MSGSATTAQSCGGVGNNCNSATSTTTSTTTCHNFIPNTWRKEICSNCFRLRDEHNSVKDLLIGRNNGTTTGAMNIQSNNSGVATRDSSMNNQIQANKPRYQSPYASSTSSGRERSPNNNLRNSIPRVSPGRDIQGRMVVSSTGGSVNKAPSPSRDAYGMTSRVSYLQTSSSINGGSTVSTSRIKQHNTGPVSHQGTSHYYTSSQTNSKVSHHPQLAGSEVKKSTNAQYGNGSGSGGLVSVNGVTVSGSALSGSISYAKSGSVKQVSNKSLPSGGMEGSSVTDGRKPKFAPQGSSLHGKKGILKSKEAKPRRMKVTFPEKVVEVIGYGGEPKAGRDSSDESDDDLLTPLDPLDNSSITEILDKNSTTVDEKEFNRLTQKNTNFNSIKTNLLGKTNIEIGPIVGCTGGKSMTANKPLISIGTFESRNEPLKIRKKQDEDSVVDGFRKIGISKKETSQTQGTQPQAMSSSSIANSKIISKNVEPIARATGGGGGGLGGVKTTSFNPTTTSIPSGSNASKEISKPKNETPRRSQSPDFSHSKQYSQPAQPKSILKSTSQFTNSSSTLVTSGIKSSLKSMNTSTSSSASNGLTNLIILTEGNTITQKRTSFLRDKAVDVTDASSGGKSAASLVSSGNPKITSDSNGVTVVNTGSLVASEVSLDLKDSLNDGTIPPKPLERTKVKVNLKEKLSHPIPFSSSCDSTSSGSGGDSEFDDSLEDSGLDIGKSSKAGGVIIMENKVKEEEACGSSSDSGNENDYILGCEKNSGGRNSSKGTSKGLFISVDEEIKSANKSNPAKLSPDSVLFPSDASEELSHGGSVESLSSASNMEVEEIVPQAAIRKRTAPRPPQSTNDNEGGQKEGETEEDLDGDEDDEGESFYDDVSTIKDKNEVEDMDEESLYDDCSTMQDPQESNKIQGGPACGSYDFQNSNGSNDDQDLIPTRPDGGVEFKGIRKIDSESFLRERSPSPANHRQRWSSSSSARERSSSTSPKPTNRKRVNQFFSTLGKKAGAAFSSSHLTGSRNKSPVTFNPSGSSCGGSDRDSPASAFGRSQSTDEVTRTQEIYATITPTSLKFKGLAPVLHKLSKIDLNLNNHSNKGRDSSTPTEDSDFYEEGGQNKLFKKHGKISMGGIKKFLRMGKESSKGHSSDTSSNGGGMVISSPYFDRSKSCSSVEEGDSSFEDGKKTPDKLKETASPTEKSGVSNKAPPMGKPPPPPPRVHSLDLLHKVGIMGPHGTVGASTTKPARPPPPVRSNKVAPSFTSVFNNPNGESGVEVSGTSLSLEDLIPPSKPKRKNSSVGRHGEPPSSHDCHIAHLNLETLKLIANQSLTKISRNRTLDTGSRTFAWASLSFPSVEPKPTCSGPGFAIYFPAFVRGEDESMCVLIQECTSAPGFSAPFQFSCVKTEATFEDTIPMDFVSWNASDYVKTERGIKGMISILPPLSLRRIQDFVKSPDISPKEKNLALLQAISFWGSADLEDLLVIKSMSSFDAGSVLYVHPTPQLARTSKKSNSCMWNDFENEMKQLLLATGEVLSPRDRSLLIEKLVGSPEQIQSQLKLFFQLKLFVPSRESAEFVKITKEGQVEGGFQKWLDKERALCMKDAVERSLSRDGNSITPYKKAYLEFLVHTGGAGGSANQISKDIVTLFNDIFE